MLSMASRQATGAGVTIITHGLNGNADGWVAGMANRIPAYHRFLGTSYSYFKLYFVPNGSSYNLTWARFGGGAPSTTDSGEIIATFDWSQLADGDSYNTYQIASVMAQALKSTTFISELNGHALCEMPIHLIGHSRGGSLICEAARLAGTNGIWVDHLTTLDPHPLNNDGFSEFLYSAVDAPCATYQNVLFHDNYWQNLNVIAYGEPVLGAYIRKLTYLDGGYNTLTASHSDVHLWYHGTVDERIPANDTEAQLTSTELFGAWYTTFENSGLNAGFKWSLIGAGDRTSTAQPVGVGFPAIRDGYNQKWDLGAGSAGNRTALTVNNGSWPNIIKLNRTETNSIMQGQSTPLKLFYQWAQPNTSITTIGIYLDDDLNPLDTNQTLLKTISVPGNGASSVSYFTTNIVLSASNAALGYHAFFAKITSGGQTRYLYAPEIVQIIPVPPPSLDIAKDSTNKFRIGVNGLAGQKIIIQYSTNFQS